MRLGRGLRLTGVAHEFVPERSGADYGREIDAELAWKLGRRAAVSLGAADYDAEAFAVDVRKVWLTARLSERGQVSHFNIRTPRMLKCET